eukprot:358688-Chlamydomonas_euryale.AAC.1
MRRSGRWCRARRVARVIAWHIARRIACVPMSVLVGVFVDRASAHGAGGDARVDAVGLVGRLKRRFCTAAGTRSCAATAAALKEIGRQAAAAAAAAATAAVAACSGARAEHAAELGTCRLRMQSGERL